MTTFAPQMLPLLPCVFAKNEHIQIVIMQILTKYSNHRAIIGSQTNRYCELFDGCRRHNKTTSCSIVNNEQPVEFFV